MCDGWAQRMGMSVQVGTRIQAWGYECLCPGMGVWVLVPEHDDTKSCAQATWWNFHYLSLTLPPLNTRMSVLSLRHECLHPGMRAQALVPRHEGIRTYAQATCWNVHNLIFDLVFWFIVPTTFEHKGISACTWAWALVPWHGHLFPGASACTQSFYIPTTCECKKLIF